MRFLTKRQLRSKSKALWDELKQGGEVVITNKGKPSAVMIPIADGDFEGTIRAIRQAKAMLAFHAMRQEAAKQGFFTEKEIDNEIAVARTASPLSS